MITSLQPDTPLVIPDAGVFRAYDIRGLVGSELTPQSVYAIGRAIATEMHLRGLDLIAVARDGRHSSKSLRDAVCLGLNHGGIDVLDLGVEPTGLLYYATCESETSSGLMITGSHNPPSYNGIKLVLDGEAQSGDQLQRLYQHILDHDVSKSVLPGHQQSLDLGEDYLQRICDSVHIRRELTIVVDAANGVAGPRMLQLLQRLGVNCIDLYCDIDGDFPNHAPDPSETHNLVDLQHAVLRHQADFGLALDGDGDRAILVDNLGQIIWPDQVLMLLAPKALIGHPGSPVIYDVKCTALLAEQIRKTGGQPVIAPTGHSLMKAAMRQHAAILGVELSGHYYFADNWYGFDDGLFASARIIEAISEHNILLSDWLATLPVESSTTEISIATTEQGKFELMQILSRDNALLAGFTVCRVDGLRLESSDGWALVRASNTSPRLTLRFAGADQSVIRRLQQQLYDAIGRAASELDLALTLPHVD